MKVVEMLVSGTGIPFRKSSCLLDQTPTHALVRATAGLEENGGRGTNGGVWEWTSTLFDGHEGLSPTQHFPGYSTDFFDGKHHVVVSLRVPFILLSN